MPVVYRGVLGQKLTIAQLDGNFQTLVTSVAAATASISGVNSSITTLQTNLASATASINTLQTNLASATASINTLQNNLASATASIDSLQTDVTTLQGDVAGVTASLSLGLTGTNDFQFIFLSAGVTYSATFSFVDGILATHSTPFAI